MQDNTIISLILRHATKMKGVLLFVASIYCAFATKCGHRRDSDGSPRIIGGTDALPHEFPWQVSLSFTLRVLDGEEHGCGASVVNENWILTAAHCCIYFPFAEFVALFGKHNLGQFEETQEARYFEKVIIHEKFARFRVGGEYDYCLVRLSEPVNFTEYIGPVCLPEPEEDYAGAMCTTSGWGRTANDGTASDILQKVDLPIWTNEECALAYAEHELNITDNMVCAGYKEGGKGACHGDSGGPLVCKRDDGSWVQVGITSWGGDQRDLCALPNEPSVFARVSYVLDWIHSTIRENSL
ncbi:plasma kallikrein-like isoform X1 [Ornithodoros turicata]|uniref:plasma kallikrein-like isoform X1 n=1 Tax=Ornithodoros turicata TaxID=34597 RepID=UPI003139E5E2